MPKISIIVPVYNVENYLRRCVDSILNQSFTDFEVILVDDGSTDGCTTICNEYTRIDSRVSVIHKKNGGVSKARNMGISLASGDYLAFVDSDDYIEDDFLEILYSKVLEDDYDCVSSGFTIVNSALEKTHGFIPDNYVKTFHSSKEQFDYIVGEVLRGKTGWEMCTRLFKKSIVHSHDIRICETCNDFGEDLAFVLTYLLYCKKVVSVQYSGYYYYQRINSMMNSSFGIVRLNEMNEVSKWYYSMLCNWNDLFFLKNYYIVHFFIMKNQLEKFFEYDCIKNAPKVVKKIVDKKWYERNIWKAVFHKKQLKRFMKKKELNKYRNLCFFTLHKNYSIYCMNEYISLKH